mgnify:CR=1 FL=1
MMARDVVELKELPDVSKVLVKALTGAVTKKGRRAELPNRSYLMTSHEQDVARLAEYCRVTGFTLRDEVPATWLHVQTFPMQAYTGSIREEGFDAYMKKYHERVSLSQANLKTRENTEPFLVDKGHRAMLDAFVRSIREDTPSPCDELAGFTSVYLARRAIESIELRQTLPIPVEKITPCIQ